MDKPERYRLLVDQRKGCARCHPALSNASVIDGGCHDADRIGAYSRWQGNLDAELMVVGQDFADVEGFRDHRGWAGERVRTNLTLVDRVAQAGVTIAPPRYGVADDRLFFTNAVLCMKSGGMQAAIPNPCFRHCGRLFLRPLVELLAPRVVVTLGERAMRAVCDAFDIRPPGRLADIVAQPLPLPVAATVLMPLYHPSPTVLNTTRSLATQRADWRRVGRVLLAVAAASKPPELPHSPHLCGRSP